MYLEHNGNKGDNYEEVLANDMMLKNWYVLIFFFHFLIVFWVLMWI